MSDDRLAELVEQLDTLESAAVTAHPQVLDEVHRGLVQELDRLAGIVSGETRSSSGRQPRSV